VKAQYSMGSMTFSGKETLHSNGWEIGTFLIFINGGPPFAEMNYGQYDTPQSLAVALASQLSCANGGLLQGYAVGATVYLVSCTGGGNTYSISAGVAGFSYEVEGAVPSFSVSTSGSSTTIITSTSAISALASYMNPTANAVSFYGTEQSGQTGALIFFVYPGSTNNGPPIKIVEVDWGASSTPSTLASALAALFPACSSSNTTVTAAVDTSEMSGPTVVFSSCNSATTYAIEAEVAGESPAGGNPSFNVLTNGSWLPTANVTIPGATSTIISDSGTVSLLLNGTQIAAASYGSSSTPASIASALASNGASNGLVMFSASGANLTMTGIGDGTITDYSYQINVSSSQSSLFTPPSFAGDPGGGDLVGGTNVPLYDWAISSYAPNGDVLAMTDPVMGSWTYTYDDFNRLTSGTATAGADAGLSLGWTYDRYGNRWAQNATGSGNAAATQPQLSFANTNQVVGWSYDADGNLLNDGRNTYAYDAEGRITTLNGNPMYLYDAEGSRVAKYSGSTITAQYLLDLGGSQVTELNNSGQWVHSNIFAGARLLATYEGPAGPVPNTYHFHLTDWLGTKRMQTTAAGNQEEVSYSYPFGDGLNCSGTDATEQHFTGRKRDIESGNEHFKARYLDSGLGRWTSPDKIFADQHGANPQSWNLYSYVRNNPTSNLDVSGLSTITFDGRANTITLYSGNGTRMVTFTAYNNVGLHNENGGFTKGPMTDGVHSVWGSDQHGASSHLGGTSTGPFGSNGIIHVGNFEGVAGDQDVTGAGLHSGESAKGGPTFWTDGCIRTTDEAMAVINLYVAFDPLTEIDVQGNEENIARWVRRAEAAGVNINSDVVDNDASHDFSFGSYASPAQNPLDLRNIMMPSDFATMYFDFASGGSPDDNAGWTVTEQYIPPNGGTPVPIQ
jgi:RHS repeat-associated protein